MNPFFTWFSMGGYSNYIWSAYGIVFLVLVLNMLSIQVKTKRTKKELQQSFRKKEHVHDSGS